MKFLIIRFSSIGDIVLTTPVIRCLKQQVPDAEVHYLTKNAFRSIIDSNPYVDKAFYVNDKVEEVLPQLQMEDYDHVIDLHHNLRTLQVKKALKKSSFSFSKLNLEKWLYTNFKINRMPDVHIVNRYLETVQSFGVVYDGRGLDYFIPEEQKINEQDIPTSHHAGYIGVVIGAALGTKKLPLEKLKQLAGAINYPIILLGGKEDKAAGDSIASVDPVRIYNSCGKFHLNESADLVRRAKLIITHDTGLMHIAAAFNKPMISVWGNTVPAFGMYALYANKQITDHRMQVNGLWCRPCSKIGYAKCPWGHFNCMQQLDMNVIAAKAHEML